MGVGLLVGTYIFWSVSAGVTLAVAAWLQRLYYRQTEGSWLLKGNVIACWWVGWIVLWTIPLDAFCTAVRTSPMDYSQVYSDDLCNTEVFGTGLIVIYTFANYVLLILSYLFTPIAVACNAKVILCAFSLIVM
jgi:hypothetical protein